MIIKSINKIGKKTKSILNKIERKQKEKLVVNMVEEKEKLNSFSPQVTLYMSGGEKCSYQANMWLKVLESLDANVIIVLREYSILYKLHKTSIPIFVLNKFHDLELLENAGVKTILYPSNPMKVTQSLRLNRLNHYFINHGESDKVVNQSKLLMAYDKILVAGQLAENRLTNAKLPIRTEQVVHVGRPLVDFLLEKKEDNSTDIKSILYAPTWEGFVEEADYCSINSYGVSLIKQLATISKTKKVYFKPHPFIGRTRRGTIRNDYKEIKEIINNSNIEYIDANESIYTYMNISDIMISDISSIITDFLYTNKPIILTNPNNYEKETLNLSFESSKALYIFNNNDNLIEFIKNIEANDSLKETRDNIKKYILGDIEEGFFNKFNNVINNSLK